LELESGSNAPMAHLLTIVMMQVISTNGTVDFDIWQIFFMFFVQYFVGLLIEYVAGVLFIRIINKTILHNKFLYLIMALRLVFFVFPSPTC
jgi:NhaP-type Na+/H+ and K+/H+ antiporters with a unique C-terminal domain